MAAALAVLMGATAAQAASREYEACLFLMKKTLVAPDTITIVDSTDFTTIGKAEIRIQAKAKDTDLKEFRTSFTCIFEGVGQQPAKLVSIEIDGGRWSGTNAQEFRDFLKVGGF
ncbi:hypothetical protein ACLBXM_17985 [Xanthobacteraceae bacterium A53D]